MSTDIEQRVVQMKFDNKQFEAGTKETMSTLDKLKSKLKFDKVEEGFGKITQAAGKVDMSGITSAVETTRFKFSALEVVAISALNNITNSVINTGKRMISSFTIDPITDGFSEYELKMNSVQTIMASTGESVEVVNQYLDELNEYSDDTIYSFSDMTESIGKFTNAGVSLNDAVQAIKGISNEAAISGANANEASRAMYNFAQAMSIGYVGLVDWRSIEQANMGTQAFKQQLIDTAEAMGTLIRSGDGWISTTTDMNGKTSDLLTSTKGFTDSLSHQWMTAEVLTETLKKYSDAETDLGKKAYAAARDVKTFSQMMDALKEAAGSGWAETWQLLIGDIEEAKLFWTSINNVLSGIISKISESRNNLLKGWKDLGGRENLIKGLSTIMSNLGKILNAVGEAFRNVFPAMTAEQLYNLTSGFSAFIEKLAFSEKTIAGVKGIFEGLFSVLKIFVELIKIPIKFIPNLVSVLSILSEIAIRVAGVFGKASSKVLEFITSGDRVEKVVDFIVAAFGKAIGAAKEFVDGFDMSKTAVYMEKLAPYIDLVKNKAIEMSNNVVTAFKEMDWALAKSKLQEGIGKIGDFFSNLYGTIKTKLKGIADTVKTFLDNVDWGEVFKFASGVVASKIFLDIASFLKKLGNAIENMSEVMKPITKVTEGVIDILDSVKDTFESYQKTLKAEALKKLAIAIGLIAGSIWLLSTIDSDKLVPALAGIGGVMAALTGVMVILNKWGNEGVKGLFGFGTAILMIAGAVKILAGIDTVKMAVGLAGIVGIIVSITGFAVILEKTKASMEVSAASMIGFASAILILSYAVRNLSDLDPASIAVSVAGIGALIVTVAASSRMLSKVGDGKGAIKILSFAMAIKQLAKAVVILKDLSWEELGKGLFGVGMLISEFAIFSKIVDGAKTMNSAVSMLIIASALTAMLVPMLILSKIGWDTTIDGLTKISLMLASLGGVLHLMPQNLLTTSIGLIGVAGAVTIMAGAMMLMSKISWEGMTKALIGLGGSLAFLSVALNLMVSTLGGSAALLVASTALVGLAAALGLIGMLPLDVIIKGLIGIGGAMLILTMAMTALAPLSGVLLASAGAMLAFGGALSLTGIGIMLVATGLVALAAGLGAMAGIVTIAVSGILTAIELLFLGFVKIAPSIAKGWAALLVAVLEGMTEVIPTMAMSLAKIIAGVFEALATYSEPIVSNFVKFLLGVVRGLSMHMPELVTELVNFFVVLFGSVVDAFSNIDFSQMMKAVIGAGIFAVFLAGISALGPLIPGASMALLGFAGLIIELMAILTLVGGLALIPGVQSLISGGSDILEAIGVAIGRFLGGITGGFAQGATSVLPTIGEHLSGFMTNATPFFDGLNKVNEGSMENILTLTKAVALLTGTSFIDGIASFLAGGSPLVKFGEKLAEFAPYYRIYADTMSGVNAGDLEKTSNAVKSLAEFSKLVPSQNGLANLFSGDKDIVKFGQKLAEFAPYFRRYADTISEVNPDTINATSTAVKSLAEFAEAIPNEGGIISLFTGDNNMSRFGEQLEDFGKSMSKYSQSVVNVDADVVKNSAEAAKALVEIADLAPNSGGVAGFFAGENSLATLAEELTKFGPSLNHYSSSVATVSVEDVKNSCEAGRYLIDLAKLLPSGDIRIAEFGKNMDSFGDSISSYATKISGINTDNMGTILDSIVKVVEISKTMYQFDASQMSQFANGMVSAIQSVLGSAASVVEANLDNYVAIGGRMMSNIALGIKKNSMSVQNAMSSIMSSAMSSQTAPVTEAIDTIINVVVGTVTNNFIRLSDAGKNVIGFLNHGITSKTGEVNQSVTNLMKSILTMLSSSRTNMQTAGVQLIVNLANGMRSRQSSVTQTSVQIVNSSSSAIRNQYWSMYNAGTYLASGLATGIRDNSYSVIQAARTLANQVAAETRSVLDIHSPSRVFEDIGMFIDKGFANGLIKYSRLTKDAAGSVGNGVIDTMKDIISSISIDNLDAAPVIRPVLDLTGVEAGASRMNGLLGGRSLAIDASANSARKASAQMRNYQNGSDAAVVSAINGLKKTIAETGGNTYNTISGITYDDSSNISNAVKDIVRAAKIGRRV